jgi:hypothetical protein
MKKIFTALLIVFITGVGFSHVTGSRVSGPNVYYNSLAENSLAGDGPHQRWATGILYDNIQSIKFIKY